MDEREAAWTVIVKVLKNNEFSDQLLHSTRKKIVNSTDRTDLFYRLVKGVIKMNRHLDFIAAQYADSAKYPSTDLKIKVILYIAFYQLRYCDFIPDHAAVHESVEMAKNLFSQPVADFVNAVLRNYQRDPQIRYPEDPVERMAVEYSFPPDIIARFIDLWGEEETEYLCMYFNDVPTLNLRVNRLATTPDKMIRYFLRKDIALTELQDIPDILVSRQPQDVLRDVALDEGYFSIQDPSQALVIQLLDPKPEENIIDFFAGLGTKTTYIAEKMRNNGEIIAIDKIPHKVKQMKQASERLQISIINGVAQDAFKYGPVAAAYDRVLLDVPCSGWGVFQKKSELRWQKAQDLNGLIKLQESALNTGAKFVAPGGTLVYSTCTMNPDENENQITKFLKSHPEFSIDNAAKYIPAQYTGKGFLRTIPHKHHLDGAFAARLKKAD